MSAHYTESFNESGLWGWQCFTCGTEAEGFLSIARAEADAEQHEQAAS